MKSEADKKCPDCADDSGVDRRQFLQGSSTLAVAAAAGAWGGFATPRALAGPQPMRTPETAVKALYDTLTPIQKKAVCFAWDYQDSRGLLRTHVSNNWQITKPTIDSEFFRPDQKEIVLEVFKGILNPDWHERIMKQLKDDSGGKPWGANQSIAIFGEPGTNQFEFVMTGRHLTMRADGNSEAHVALGGPIFHGHAASGGIEKVHHPGNVFWHQAVLANNVYQMLSGKQQEQALVAHRPAESAVAFRGPTGKFPGIPVSELTRDQRDGLQKVLLSLIEPYRKIDQDEVLACIMRQGGLDRCSLAFYRDGDVGDDGEWDNWRLEGPSLVWYFRGEPHVHIWINVADDPGVQTNAKG
jgi:Protein of unknown function (DUF3500)